MTAKTVEIKVTHRFSASSERVFDAWLDPQAAGQWLFATPNGEMVRVEIDARVGGKFNFTDRRDGEDVEHTGEYLEIDRPRRLAFSVLVKKYFENAHLVAIDIVPLESGCLLTLTHTGIPDLPEYTTSMKQGWAGILEDLDSRL